MKRLILSGLFSAVLVIAGISSVLANGGTAPEAAAEGLEISGNVDIVSGWQHDDKDAANVGVTRGGMGDIVGGLAAGTGNRDVFRFVVDQVEIDLAKSFGENIRLRADIDFNDLANGGHRGGLLGSDTVDIEQAYVTANIAAGNGIEFLVGKFNAPVGIESPDRLSNWLISYSDIFRFITPTNVTGAKLYYAFNDNVDLHIAAVNSLFSQGFGDSALPSALFRVGYNWGEEGNESTVGLSGGAGPEWTTQSLNSHWDFFGDLDAMIAVTDTINIGAEGVYRQTDAITVNAQNQKIIAGQLLLNYEASDVWDVTFRYGYTWDFNGPLSVDGASTSLTASNFGGFEGTNHSGTIGAGYQIADGAKLKMEYRFDFAAVSGPANNADFQSVMAEFAYTF